MVYCKEVFPEDQQVLVFRRVRRVLVDRADLEDRQVRVLVVGNRVEMGYHRDCYSRVVEAVGNTVDEEDTVVYNSLGDQDLDADEDRVDRGVVAFLRVQSDVAFLRVQTMDRADDVVHNVVHDGVHNMDYVVVDNTVVVVTVSNICGGCMVVVAADSTAEGGNNLVGNMDWVGSKDQVGNRVVGNRVVGNRVVRV